MSILSRLMHPAVIFLPISRGLDRAMDADHRVDLALIEIEGPGAHRIVAAARACREYIWRFPGIRRGARASAPIPAISPCARSPLRRTSSLRLCRLRRRSASPGRRPAHDRESGAWYRRPRFPAARWSHSPRPPPELVGDLLRIGVEDRKRLARKRQRFAAGRQVPQASMDVISARREIGIDLPLTPNS